jgi:hypothetical protein
MKQSVLSVGGDRDLGDRWKHVPDDLADLLHERLPGLDVGKLVPDPA